MRWILLGAVAACQIDEPGGSAIAVGNPPTATARIVLAAPGDGVEFDTLNLPVSGVYLEDCDGLGEVVTLDPPVEVGLRGSSVRVPAGDYCVIGLVPGGQAALSGAAGEGTFRFASVMPRILLYGELALEADQALAIELAEPAWIDAAAFGLAAGEHREVGGARCSSDPLCARILTALAEEAGLFDDDGDGRVDDDEREAGERATGSGRRERR